MFLRRHDIDRAGLAWRRDTMTKAEIAKSMLHQY
jgi:hypothetical protein